MLRSSSVDPLLLSVHRLSFFPLEMVRCGSSCYYVEPSLDGLVVYLIFV